MKISCDILNPAFFLKYMKNVSNFCDEGLIHFNNGIRFVGLDGSRIVVMELKLGDDIVKVDNNIKLVAPVSLSKLSKITARFRNPEHLNVTFDESINMLIIKGKINNRTKTFRLASIDIDEDFKDPIPILSKIQYNAIFKISGKELLDAVKDCEMFSESVALETKNNIFIVSTDGISGDTETKIDMGVEIYGNEKSDYSIHFLKKILPVMGGMDILVMLKSDYPLAIYDKLSDKSHMLYYLAPRITEEFD